MAKFISIAVLLIALGAGGAYVYVNYLQPPTVAPTNSTEDAAPADHDHADDAKGGHDEAVHADTGLAGSEHLHGGAAASGTVALCTKHSIPVSVCAFCDPSLKDKLGWCKGHDVAEALCTRCSPILIPAFKIEGDWCEAHGLPESQCRLCAEGAAKP